jgi:hypothetical protein
VVNYSRHKLSLSYCCLAQNIPQLLEDNHKNY